MNIEKITNWYFAIFPLKIMKYHNYKTLNFVKNISDKYDKEGKKILDIGAWDCDYRKFFSKLKYYSQDVIQNKANIIDYVCDICEHNDIASESFDYILCTQVLEHLKEPSEAFGEFNRILKKGGLLFLTTNMCYEEHMIPHDYFRFTKYGLRYLGEKNGFKLKHIAPHGGIFQVIARIANTLPITLFFKRDSRTYYLYIVIFTVPIFVFNLVCYFLDFLDKEKPLTLNYECIYEKISRDSELI